MGTILRARRPPCLVDWERKTLCSHGASWLRHFRSEENIRGNFPVSGKERDNELDKGLGTLKTLPCDRAFCWKMT